MRSGLNPSNKYKGSSRRPHGIRHYYREMLFRHVRPQIKGKTWTDFGAGDSYTVINLIHPELYQYRYIATDVSIEGLRKGCQSTGQTPIQSTANHPPFPDNSAYVVSGFGI